MITKIIYICFALTAFVHYNDGGLLGTKKCTSGPSFWCSNITNAKKCGAVQHCIQTVWEKQLVPEDSDSVCQICLDMVKQARDQLRSNETQNDLKLVFEGSCKLMPLKVIKKECIKLADDFIPELVEALSSQMNPQVVCSVAGLCNNAVIDVMLENKMKNEQEVLSEVSYKNGNLKCSNCFNITNILKQKLKTTDRNVVRSNMYKICREMSSFSEACTSLITKYFSSLYDEINTKFNAEGICHLSGACSSKYHHHSDDTIPSNEIATTLNGSDNLPCELCEQLVHHLKDLLIANTTEIEFKQVLEGMCNQTKGFRTECLSIVDQYYDVIYQYLMNNLDANAACFLIGVCPKGSTILTPTKIEVSIKEAPQIRDNQLSVNNIEAGELCTLCEYFMHFLQESLSTPVNEEKIKEAIKGICVRFPKTLQGECKSFVDMYGDAVIALIVQGIDAREVCPKIKLCPQNLMQDVHSKVLKRKQSACPLCLLAVNQAQIKIKSDKSKAHIRYVLENLCSHLPKQNIKDECKDFVSTYSSELIEMLVGDFSPQEICVYLQLCHNNTDMLIQFNLKAEKHENVLIPNKNMVNIEETIDVKKNDSSTPQCLLCETVLQEVEHKFIHNKTKTEIKEALMQACGKLKHLEQKCDAMITKFGDKIADLILAQMTPKQICAELGYCAFITNENTDNIKEEETIDLNKNDSSTPQCLLCEKVVEEVERKLIHKKSKEEIKQALMQACGKLKHLEQKCDAMITKFGDKIADLILAQMTPKQICAELGYCIFMFDLDCGVCHGASIGLTAFHNKENLNDLQLNKQKMIEKSCEVLPAKFFEKCSLLIEYYGKSMINLVRDNSSEVEICAKIGKCFNAEGHTMYLRILNEQNNRL